MHQAMRSRLGEIEFHQQAAIGEPEKVIPLYKERNAARRQLFCDLREGIEGFSPFLEIGAHSAYTSALLESEFDADGVAVDIALHALKAAPLVAKHLGFNRSPLKVCCDAGRLPVKDGSFKLVVAFQTLHHFQDPEPVIQEIRRMLAPGGSFVFAEEPVRRKLCLYLYKTRRVEDFNKLERWLDRMQLLRYVAYPYFGCKVEEEYGIIENQKISAAQWRRMFSRHFDDVQLDYSGANNMGRDARVLARFLARITSSRKAAAIAADLMGCELRGICRVLAGRGGTPRLYTPTAVASTFCCPDCGADLLLEEATALVCRGCGYKSLREHDVFNLLPSREKALLFGHVPGKVLDFADAGHEARLGRGWHELSGSPGSQWRWTAQEASVTLLQDTTKAEFLRIQGYVAPISLDAGKRLKMTVSIDNVRLGTRILTRAGRFVYEEPIPSKDQSGLPREIEVTIGVDKVIKEAGSGRDLGLVICDIRLIALE